MAIEPTTGHLLERLARRADAFMVPKPMPDEPGRFIVDGTWGTINPIELAPGVRTVGELEVRLLHDLCGCHATTGPGSSLPTTRWIIAM